MKNKHLLIIVVVLSIIAIISSFNKTTFFNNVTKEKEMEVVIKNKDTNKEDTLNLEDYIIGVVAGEMPASFHEEALMAQAIAARTYAVYKVESSNASYDLVTDVSNQVYIDKNKMKEKWGNDYLKYYEKIKEVVLKTKGIIMKYDGKVISSYYFAMSNGKTEDVSLVFGESRDYLKSVDSPWDKNVNNFLVDKTLSKKEFCQKLKIDCSSIKLSNIKRSDTGRVNTIKINDKTFKGTEIRKLLELRSTDFKIEISDEVKITTKGYGHGVGMSQYGANELAKQGWNYEEILKYYYKDITLEKISV